jgi:putative PEP-CTERM system histidine kinase
MSPSQLLVGAAATATLTLGAALLPRLRWRDPAQWALAAALISTGIAEVFHVVALEMPFPDDAARWQSWRLACLAAAPGAWLVFSLNFARAHSQSSDQRFWRTSLAAACLLPVGFAVAQVDSLATAFVPRQANHDAFTEIGPGAVLLLTFTLAASLAAALSLERTHRAAHGLARWRSKFMIIGAACALGGLFYLASQALLFHAIAERASEFTAAGELLATGLIARSLVRLGPTPPALHPSGPLLAGTVTLALAGAYFLTVGLLARAANLLGGDAAFTLKSLFVVAALCAGALLLQSDRLRAGLRRSVSLHLNRPLHDHRLVWRRFNTLTNRCTTAPTLAEAVAQLLSNELQCLSVSIWLCDETSTRMLPLASTGDASAIVPTPEESEAVLQQFRRHPSAKNFEDSSAPWSAALRRWQPNAFLHGSPRLAVTLRRGPTVDGIILVGDRVGADAWTHEETDLLADLAEQTAAALERLRLAERSQRHRQWEAFQTMAAFFVHDLKNATASLSLLLQNLPAHFDDPAFRADARRDIATTASHLDRLIARLASLREGVAVQARPADLGELVRTSLGALPLPAGVKLTVECPATPAAPLDRELLTKVITNLVLNAAEAVTAEGQITVLTTADAEHVILTVRDNGCGMTPEFQRDALFQPFQTTKRRGLGIGMFQSRMIVEAHGGSITVASAPGQGTTFTVSLPRAPSRIRTAPPPATVEHLATA